MKTEVEIYREETGIIGEVDVHEMQWYFLCKDLSEMEEVR